MGAQLTCQEKVKYKRLISEFRDIFAWSYKDIKGIPPEIVQHTIPLIPSAHSIRQKEMHEDARYEKVLEREKM